MLHTSTQKINDSIETETTCEQKKKCSEIKLQQKLLFNQYISSLITFCQCWIHTVKPLSVFHEGTAQINDTHRKVAVVGK
jgi:hypothetical protein